MVTTAGSSTAMLMAVLTSNGEKITAHEVLAKLPPSSFCDSNAVKTTKKSTREMA
jgi:hypothetical protein